jgi:hypothetical protein
MSLSSIIVVANALRLTEVRGNRQPATPSGAASGRLLAAAE